MSPQSTGAASLIHSELETWALPITFPFQLRKSPPKVIQPEYIPTWERQRNSDREWREVTPCPVSWWAVKGPEREPSSHPTGFCLCWQPCFSGNSLGTGSGKRWLWCWWESSWGGWSGSKLGSHQLKQAKEKSWGLSSVTRPDNWMKLQALPTVPLFLICGRVRVSLGERKHPSRSHVLGPALWAGSNWTLQPVLLSLCLCDTS